MYIYIFLYCDEPAISITPLGHRAPFSGWRLWWCSPLPWAANFCVSSQVVVSQFSQDIIDLRSFAICVASHPNSNGQIIYLICCSFCSNLVVVMNSELLRYSNSVSGCNFMEHHRQNQQLCGAMMITFFLVWCLAQQCQFFNRLLFPNYPIWLFGPTNSRIWDLFGSLNAKPKQPLRQLDTWFY